MEARTPGPAWREHSEARIRRAHRLPCWRPCCWSSMGAQQRSANFIVETPDPNFAQQLAQAAEKYRHDLAIEWLGQAMPNWSQPCVMTVQVGPHLAPAGPPPSSSTAARFSAGG